MKAVLIAWHHLGRIPKKMEFDSKQWLSLPFSQSNQKMEPSTHKQPFPHYLAPSARGPSRASCTLYSWTIPFWLSSGGGCQVTTIAVPFPSFLVTETLWGGALGAVCSERRIEWLHLSHPQVSLFKWKMTSKLYKCNLFSPILHRGQVVPTRWSDTAGKCMTQQTGSEICCSFAVQDRKSNAPNCTLRYPLPACHSSGHWVPHWSQISSPRINSFEK